MSEFETVKKLSDTLFVVRKLPSLRHTAPPSSDGGSSDTTLSSPSKAPVLRQPSRRNASYAMRRVTVLDKQQRDAMMARILLYKSRLSRSTQVWTACMTNPTAEFSSSSADGSHNGGGLTTTVHCAAAVSLLAVAHAFANESLPVRGKTIEVLFDCGADDPLGMPILEYNNAQAAASMFGVYERRVDASGGLPSGEQHSPNTARCGGWLADEAFSWSEEMLWRLMASLCGALAVVHQCGLHYNGAISAEEVYCRALSHATTSSLQRQGEEVAEVGLVSPTLRPFSAGYQSPKHHTNKTSNSHRVEWSTVPPHSFQFLLCLPSCLLDPSNSLDLLTVNQVRLIQASDVGCIGDLLLSIVETRMERAAKASVSSELMFLIKRMCTASDATPRPTALQITQFQAVQLRIHCWMIKLSFEVDRHQHQEKEQTMSKEADALSRQALKMEARVRELERAAQDVKESRSDAISVSERERLVAVREDKLNRFLSLYELTSSKLDAMALTDGSVELFKGVLDATRSNMSLSRQLSSASQSQEGPMTVQSAKNVPAGGFPDRFTGPTLDPSSRRSHSMNNPSTPTKQNIFNATPQMSPLAVIHSNNVSVEAGTPPPGAARSRSRDTAPFSYARPESPYATAHRSTQILSPTQDEIVVIVEMDADEDMEPGSSEYGHPQQAIAKDTSDGIPKGGSQRHHAAAAPTQRDRLDTQFQQLQQMQKHMQQSSHTLGANPRVTPVKSANVTDHTPNKLQKQQQRSPSAGGTTSRDVHEAAAMLRHLRKGVQLN